MKSLFFRIKHIFIIFALVVLPLTLSSCFAFSEIKQEDLGSVKKSHVVVITTDAKTYKVVADDILRQDSTFIINTKWIQDTIKISDIKSVEAESFDFQELSLYIIGGLVALIGLFMLIFVAGGGIGRIG